MNLSRRNLLAATVAAPVVAASKRPTLGIVVSITGRNTPETALARVHNLGLSSCQVSAGATPGTHQAPALTEALARYNVQATAVMTLGPGNMVWDFYEGPQTIGLVPRGTRAARVDALKRASDLAKACKIGAVHTHCGFIPENPNDPTYAETVQAIRDVAIYCKGNGQMFLMETGQESPITMLRAIRDAGSDNIAVNLDTANLILYGKGEPVGALDVLGPLIGGVHAKDGLYPTDPHKLGKETAIGRGRVNFPDVVRGLARLSYAGPITIEREISGPQQETDIRAAVEYLRELIERAYV